MAIPRFGTVTQTPNVGRDRLQREAAASRPPFPAFCHGLHTHTTPVALMSVLSLTGSLGEAFLSCVPGVCSFAFSGKCSPQNYPSPVGVLPQQFTQVPIWGQFAVIVFFRPNRRATTTKASGVALVKAGLLCVQLGPGKFFYPGRQGLLLVPPRCVPAGSESGQFYISLRQ